MAEEEESRSRRGQGALIGIHRLRQQQSVGRESCGTVVDDERDVARPGRRYARAGARRTRQEEEVEEVRGRGARWEELGC